MTALHVENSGDGPRVLLVHGGASPRTTWAGLEPLAGRWTLARVHRRGFASSPAGSPDPEVDARDLDPLLRTPAHVVAHSYGCLGSVLVAARTPTAVRSLTLVEPPLYGLVPDDTDVRHLARITDVVARDGLDADPVALREFLGLAGSGDLGAGPLPEPVARAVRRAHGARSPSLFPLATLDALRETAVPVLVVSGGHSLPLERICDAAAERLGAGRAVCAGAGHLVAAAPGFAAALERHLGTAA